MEIIYVSLRAIMLYSISGLILAKPFEEDKSYSDEHKLHCVDSNEGLGYEKSNTNSFSEYYKPRSTFESLEKYPNSPMEYNEKRSASDNLYTSSLQKRQVGVVYRDDRPIGILQPFQRSYRFIPVKEDNPYSFTTNQVQDLDKREIENINIDPVQLDETYPSILTNFKIVNKLDKKRNYDSLTDDNIRDLKATIRRLRSSNSLNNEQIEEELKNILDDMGLIEDEEVHGGKREVTQEQMDNESELSVEDDKTDKDRNKRDEICSRDEKYDSLSKGIPEQNLMNSDDKKIETKNDIFSYSPLLNKREFTEESYESQRKKRQKQEVSRSNKKDTDLVENLKESGDLMFSGNKSPLASSSEIIIRETDNKESDRPFEDEDGDYEGRIERQIQTKINSLKEEVKREIEAIKTKQNGDQEDAQREKRQVLENLVNEETDELNPALNPEGELKPLIRKRRHLNVNHIKDHVNLSNSRKKRETNFAIANRKKRSDHSPNVKQNNQYNHNARREENDEGGELLGGDDFDDGAILKREAYKPNQKDENMDEYSNLNNFLNERYKRLDIQPNDLDLYDNYLNNNYFYDNNGRLKRQNFHGNNLFAESNFGNRFVPLQTNRWRSRSRRRINENQMMANRPQQLSDMSDLDLFGALPKSYNGELSRYKRVKRK